MKICFIGDAGSSHMVKWCTWFSEHGHEVHVISFTPGGELYNTSSPVLHLLDLNVDVNGSDAGKLKYLLTGRKIKKLVRDIDPDVVNVHYATSYGIAVALSGLEDYVLSVWGSDIYEFPKKSPIHRSLLKLSLRRPTLLMSTSQAMADEAAQYTKRRFVITPFGVDMELFRPDRSLKQATDFIRTGDVDSSPADIATGKSTHETSSDSGQSVFTIGTVKTLAPLYGIDYLLRGVALVYEERPDIPLRIRIAGDGPQESELHDLAETLGIADITAFLGRIPQEEAVREYNRMDVVVFPSIYFESFGVAAVEAQACETPLIVSEVGGLMETTQNVGTTSVTSDDNISAIVVPRQDARAIADAVIRLHDDPELRKKMSVAGRANVVKKYELNHCFLRIEKVLTHIANREKRK